jgi:Flp pilus assembly protein TadG
MDPRPSIRAEHGQSLVEFAFILPLLMMLLLGIIQFGIVYNNYVTLTDATRAAARKAAVGRFSPTDPAVAAENVARSSAPALTQSDLKVTVNACTDDTQCTATTDWKDSGGTVVVTATYPYRINILGWVVKAGDLSSTTKERLE